MCAVRELFKRRDGSEWALIALLLPAARPGRRPRTICLRRVVDAIFYLLQAGCQWRMLPRDFPRAIRLMTRRIARYRDF